LKLKLNLLWKELNYLNKFKRLTKILWIISFTSHSNCLVNKIIKTNNKSKKMKNLVSMNW
jgi:hypothetical protein